MPSLQGILNPGSTATQDLENNALLNQPVIDPGTGTYLGQVFDNTIKDNPASHLIHKMASKGSPNYNQDQLQMLYPDTPPDMWKGGANAYQAEYLYDRYIRHKRQADLYDYVTGVNDPYSGHATSGLVTDALTAAVNITGGLLDPVVTGAFMAANPIAAKLAGPLSNVASKIAPTIMEQIASSRFASGALHEIATNVVGESAVMYPLRKSVIDDFTKEDTSITDVVANAIGGAIVFHGLKTLKSKAFVSLKDNGAAFYEKVVNENFTKNKDKVNASVNSESANSATLEEAVAHSANPELKKDKVSISERMSEKAFDGNRPARFESGSEVFWGVAEKKSGKTDYVGERFGDSHVFVSSKDAAQGIFDSFAKNGNEYQIIGHDGNVSALNIDEALAVDHPGVLDAFSEHPIINKILFDKLEESSTLGDAYRIVNDIATENGISGKDVTELFNNANSALKESGYQGTIHIEKVGRTSHEVLSVFDGEIRPEQVSKLHEGVSEAPIEPKVEEPINAKRERKAVKISKTEEIEIDPTMDPNEGYVFDDFYDEDPDFIEAYNYFNSDEFFDTPHFENDPNEIKMTLKERVDNLLSDIKMSEDLDAELKQEFDDMLRADLLENREAIMENRKKLKKMKKGLEEIQDKIAEHTPEKEREVAKAMENCGRKG